MFLFDKLQLKRKGRCLLSNKNNKAYLKGGAMVNQGDLGAETRVSFSDKGKDVVMNNSLQFALRPPIFG